MALGFPDFRAAERTFQLLTQVAGRAGRGQAPGKVVLQTYFPNHYAVQYAAQHDFMGFYEKELRFRSWMHYPPYSALANVLVRSNKLDEALRWSGILGKWFEKTRHESIRVLGPAVAGARRATGRCGGGIAAGLCAGHAIRAAELARIRQGLGWAGGGL